MPSSFQLDRLTPFFMLLGLGPSWMLLDGVFSELAIFDRTQPEGLALATYLTAVSALANTIVVPGHAAAQRRLKCKSRTWVGAAVYASVAAAVTLALFWDYSVGGASLALYAAVFLASLAGNAQQLALNPWAAETGRARRIVELMAGGNAGALLPAGLAMSQRDARLRRQFGPGPFFACLLALILGSVAAFHAVADQPTDAGDASPKPAENPLRELEADGADETKTPETPETPSASSEDADPGAPCSDDDAELLDATAPKTAWENRIVAVSMPPVAAIAGEPPKQTEARTREARRLAHSSAAYQLVSWVVLRSCLPYACAAAAPRGGGDGAVFLAVGINGSLVACFLGAGLATRKGAMISPAAGDAIVGAGLGLVAVAGGASALFGRPATALPGILVVAGSWLVRAADGFCSPLFYRRIHEVSGSVDVLQWAGILSIWVVNLGVWATLVVVVSMNYA